MRLQHGIRLNSGQFLHQLLQVFFVGLTIGMTRTVVPALAESEFDVPRGSFVLLTAFVVSFGAVKAIMNFVAGALSERLGRRHVLLIGWIVAIPIPLLIWLAPTWNWIVAATVLLGINQGLTWSMTQTAKLDIAAPGERGLAIGLDEFAGYIGVAAAGLATAYLATVLAPREGLMVFGFAVIGLALVLTRFCVRETLPWAKQEAAEHSERRTSQAAQRHLAAGSARPSPSEVFTLMSWRDRRLAAVSQAGLVEKFVDALVWALYPVFLYQHGISLTNVGWVVGVYGFVWGSSQLVTGRLSDRVGRHRLNVWGMWICASGVSMMLLGEGMAWWSFSAAISGLGMGMLYPNLSAAVADIAHPDWRGSAIGIYRFWRDLGYAIGGLGIGAAAHLSGQVAAAFWFVAISMYASGAVLWWFGEETRQ
jgi:MFS family permease